MKIEEREHFESVTAEHTVTVLRDDDLYRHLRCQKPGTWIYGFDIVTWPGHLAFTGDVGDFVFSGINDMFEFFRGQSPNPDYWSEKLRGPGPAHQAVMDFDHDAFALAAGVRGLAVWDTPFNAQDAARLLVEDGLDPYDLPKMERYSTQFLLACHAIPWAIARYDEAKSRRVLCNERAHRDRARLDGPSRRGSVHPGEVLQEALDERGMSQSYLAWATGFTQKHINFVCKGRSSITAQLALALEDELEVSAEFWMAAQTNYDLDLERAARAAQARRKGPSDVG